MKFAPDNPKTGMYIHWPYCSRLCPYCDFNIYRARNQDFDGLVTAIIAEIKFWARENGAQKLSSIFFGGGTPSLLEPAQVEKILEICNQKFGFENDIEISLEANPNNFEKFHDFANAGINRLSLGVQSFDDENLQFLGRFHNADLARKACETARLAFKNFSIDMIYALPNQTNTNWAADLGAAISFEPNHISPYQLTIEENTAFERKQRRGIIKPPNDEISAELYDLTDEVLAQSGFEKYEISNHAKGADFQSKHNLLYWQSQNWLGIGPGAHGRIWDKNRRATLNIARPNEYIESVRTKSNGLEIDENLTDREAFEEFLMMGLRINEGMEWQKICDILNPETVKELSDLGLITQSQTIKLTSKGQKLSNAIIAKLLT